MENNRVPITRLGMFFGEVDYELEKQIGREYLGGDLNFTCILYKVDKGKTKTDDVYGEALKDGIKFLPPVEFKALVQVMPPDHKKVGNSMVDQIEPGQIKISVYVDELEELGIDIDLGDYIGYQETEDRRRYYVITSDGRVFNDNHHTYFGYKPFYKTLLASYISPDEFQGL